MDPSTFGAPQFADVTQPGISTAASSSLPSDTTTDPASLPVLLSLETPRETNYTIGRNEAALAAQQIMANTQNNVVDISSEEAFAWKRWLANVTAVQEIIGAGIVKVFLLRRTVSDNRVLQPIECPWYVFCRSDNSCAYLDPTKKSPQYFQNWIGDDRFHDAVQADSTWLRL